MSTRQDNGHVVILIGGPPGAGKTTLSLALGQRLGISSMSFDDLHAGIRGLTTPESHPDLHRVGRGHHLAYFTNSDPSELRADAMAEHTAMWPGIERMTLRRSKVGPSAVVDSWMLRPSLVASLAIPNVHALWLHIAPEELERRERANSDFLDGSSEPTRMFDNFMSRSLWWNELIAEEATANGMPLLEQDGATLVDDLVDQAVALVGG